MYNYLELVNSVARRLNEVELTNTNFGDARGFHADIKSYVSEAINRVNTEQFEWPFNHVTELLVLTPNQVKYPLPEDTKSVAYDTFILQGDSTLSVRTARLKILDYEEHLEKTPDWEVNPENHAGIPRYVFRPRDLSFGILPAPKEAYTLRYEYYRLPNTLMDWDDIPTIPERFKWVILEGALYYAYLFKGDLDAAAASDQKFVSGLKDMRKLYINRYEYVNSNVLGG